MRLKRFRGMAFALILASGAASAAYGADLAPLDADAAAAEPLPPPEDSSSSWEVEITPYFWLAGMKGDLDLPRGSGSVDFNDSYSDVLGKLKFVFMGAMDVRKGRFVAMADTIYLNLSADVKGIKDPQFFTGQVDSKLFFSTLSGGYRIVDKGPFYIDLFAGLRYISIDNKVRLEGPLATREGKASGSDLGPLVGARMRVPLGPKWGFVMYGDTGGFASSDIKWQLLGTLQWDISRHWRAIAGYRHMDVHHKRDDQDFNIALTGPLLGITYRF
jgi:hypothetical protein